MKTVSSIAAFLLLISTADAQNDFSFKETYPIRTPAQIRISSSDGNIEVAPAPSNEVQVFYIARKHGALLDISRAELEKELTLEVVHESNRLEIRVRYPETNGWWSWRDRVRVSFRLLVPQEAACDLRTSDGNIALKGLTSDQICKTSDGNIRAENIRGSMTGNTSDGNVSMTDIRGDVEIRTSDGDINVEHVAGYVKAGTSDGDIYIGHVVGSVNGVTSDGNVRLSQLVGDVDVRTSDGDISFEDLSGSFRGVTSDGSIYGNMIALKNELSARTGDGRIRITIPGNLGLDLNIRGESVQVPLTNFSGRSEDKSIQGRTNGGGIAVNLSSSDGSVSLAYE